VTCEVWSVKCDLGHVLVWSVEETIVVVAVASSTSQLIQEQLIMTEKDIHAGKD
jgi:hypothetical protein